MTTNKKAAPLATGTAQNFETTANHSTVIDPLKAWHDLAKPSRDRKQKSAWKRGKQRGSATLQAIMAGAAVALLAWWQL